MRGVSFVFVLLMIAPSSGCSSDSTIDTPRTDSAAEVADTAPAAPDTGACTPYECKCCDGSYRPGSCSIIEPCKDIDCGPACSPRDGGQDAISDASVNVDSADTRAD